MTFVIGRPQPLWIKAPHRLSGGPRQPEKKRNVFPEGVPYQVTMSPSSGIFPISWCHLWEHGGFGGGLVEVSPNLGMAWGFGGGLVLVFETEQEQCHLQQSAAQR